MNLENFVGNFVVVILGFLAARFDHKHFLIPNKYTGAIYLILAYQSFKSGFGQNVFIYAVVVGMHFAIAYFFPSKFGMGDSKFIAALGLGFSSTHLFVFWLYLAYLIGSIHGIWLKFRSKSLRIPFGVSIYAAWVAIYMGEYAHVAMDYGW